AWLPKAQASQVLPTPVGPVSNRLCCWRIQSPLARVASWRSSMPLPWRRSRTSRQAPPYLSLACLRSRSRRLLSRQASSRSSSRPSRSSKLKLWLAGSVHCSSSALAMPLRRSWCNCLSVCCVIIEQLLLGVIVGTAHVLVASGLCGGGLGQWLLVEPLFEQVAYGAAVERAQLDGAMGRRFKALVAVLAGQREQAQAGA